MNIEIEKSRAEGKVNAPPAKSFIHRQIICAALSGGESVVHNICESDDVLATADCTRALGADVKIENGTAYIKSGGKTSEELYCRQSGSTLRFFIPVCLMQNRKFTLYGSPRLMQRPLDVYEELCGEQGVLFERYPDKTEVCGKLDLRGVTVSGAISSQFITGLMLAAPLSDNDCFIHVKPPFVSRPYVDVTAEVMAQFGVTATVGDDDTIFIKGDQKYAPAEVTAEGDWSGAAFLYALGLINGDVKVAGLNENSTQGDRIIIKQFEQLKQGCADIDVSDCPDNAPVLMACAAALYGATLYGTSRLKIKESDRGAAMAEELLKFGVKTEIYDNKIKIRGGIKAPVTEIYGHDDHRIVMACSVLCSLTGGTVCGAEAVGKSYPGFFDDISKLGIKIKEIK
ncbi:MAG: 3-phosphoshikimate 1-carboxyvinyltransferase [Clostridia bacterium]|nr:3-phosphoshikimate 1-carboxyvinyltransferase [Clostridia bacterium]